MFLMSSQGLALQLDFDLRWKQQRVVNQACLHRPQQSRFVMSIQVRSGWNSHPQGGLHRSPVFGTGAVGLSASRSNAESERFELPRRSSRPAPLPTVPSCHPDNLHVRGRRADRTPAGLPPRPPVSNRVPYQLGQPSVRREGLAPSRPFRDTGFWGPRVCIPPPALGVAGEI